MDISSETPESAREQMQLAIDNSEFKGIIKIEDKGNNRFTLSNSQNIDEQKIQNVFLKHFGTTRTSGADFVPQVGVMRNEKKESGGVIVPRHQLKKTVVDVDSCDDRSSAHKGQSYTSYH